jgi:hypothetical protein
VVAGDASDAETVRGLRMWWQVGVCLAERQRGLAVLAARCAERNVLVLELRTTQEDSGRFGYEVVLLAPGAFTEADVRGLFADLATYGDIDAAPMPAPVAAAEPDASRRPRRRLRPVRSPVRHLGRAVAGAAVMLTVR